jgi:hypothetical protein
MGSRLELQDVLEDVLGSPNVYYQAPASVQMVYPCIRYSRYVGDTKFAADKPYLHSIQYEVMVIGKDPDSPTLATLAMLPTCVFVRHYTADNLNHDVYNLYF